jgi:pilus assembly protein CpaF
VLVSGGTGTGKTTNLNVLSSFIPDGERIITIEDSAELQLQQPHVITLETRPPNAEGSGQVTIRELVKNSLRMRPDRIIVGECRAAEALDMLQAMNTGHEGSMTTVHANTARDAISRLETMVLMAGFDLPVRAIREQIASALHLILQVTRLPDGKRVITSLTEVQGMEGDIILLQDVFKFETIPSADKKYAGELVATGLRPKFVDKLIEHGVEVPAAAFRAPRRAQAPMPSRRATTRAPKARDIAEKERLR